MFWKLANVCQSFAAIDALWREAALKVWMDSLRGSHGKEAKQNSLYIWRLQCESQYNCFDWTWPRVLVTTI